MNFNDFEQKYPALMTCLKRARKERRLAHAYLLHGDTPQIRNDFAVALAQLSSCLQPKSDGAPCGVCQVCDQLCRGVYSEYYTLTPVGKKLQIQVGDRTNPEPNTVRWFEEQFYFTSIAGGGRKIGVIFDADRMNTESQNAFLKTLEEPPPDSFFIVATGNPAALLPTTRSRCHGIMVLENHCEFNFIGAPELFATLHKLQFLSSRDLVAAEQAAGQIIMLSRQLENQADSEVSAIWATRIEQAEEMDSAFKKRLDKHVESGVAGEYVRIRNYFMSAIHTWFAQVYQLSCGVPQEFLANPEVFDNLTLPDISEEKAAGCLEEAEKLLYNLRFMVSEELAIRSFCMNVAMKH